MASRRLGVRDVRDVALSEFAFEKHLGIGRATMDQYLDDMLVRGKRHGSWPHHVESWLDSPLAKRGDLLFLRYENLRSNGVEQFAEIAEFLRVKVNRDTIARAIANNTVQRMREKEDSLYKQDSYANVPRRPLQGVDKGGRFVRS